MPFALPKGNTPSGNTISGTGTVTLVNLQGGFYGITSSDGINYDPINLGKDYQQDGLKVQFAATIRSDMVNTHQWGTIVELSTINKLP